jgi:Uma2 family endonuclease
MSPKGLEHEAVKIALADRWYRLPHDDCGLAVATTFRLSEDTYLESDAVIYPRATGLKEIAGANALLVVESADSSLRYDMGRKATLYASFGVRELWAIDAARLTARVFADPSPEGYRSTQDFDASDPLAPRFAPRELALRLDELDLA